MSETITITTESGTAYEVEIRSGLQTESVYAHDEDGRYTGTTQVPTGRHYAVIGQPGRYHMASATAATEAKAIAKAIDNATKTLEKREMLEGLYLAAKAVAADLDGAVPAEGQTAADFFVGQRVAVWSHNRRRVGLVTKVGRTNITAAVVVASSGNMVTATSKFESTVILEIVEPEHIATDDVPCKHCGGPTMAPYTGKDGYRYEDYYCEACADLTSAPAYAPCTTTHDDGTGCYGDFCERDHAAEPVADHPPYGWCRVHADYHHCEDVSDEATRIFESTTRIRQAINERESGGCDNPSHGRFITAGILCSCAVR